MRSITWFTLHLCTAVIFYESLFADEVSNGLLAAFCLMSLYEIGMLRDGKF